MKVYGTVFSWFTGKKAKSNPKIVTGAGGAEAYFSTADGLHGMRVFMDPKGCGEFVVLRMNGEQERVVVKLRFDPLGIAHAGRLNEVLIEGGEHVGISY